jgi:hypothetical protein
MTTLKTPTPRAIKWLDDDLYILCCLADASRLRAMEAYEIALADPTLENLIRASELRADVVRMRGYLLRIDARIDRTHATLAANRRIVRGRPRRVSA